MRVHYNCMLLNWIGLEIFIRKKCILSSSTQLAFSDSIRKHIDKEVPGLGQQVVGETKVWNCDIIIAHGVREPKCADHFFACKNNCQTVLWCLCFPFCLVTGLPYLLYKRFFM